MCFPASAVSRRRSAAAGWSETRPEPELRRQAAAPSRRGRGSAPPARRAAAERSGGCDPLWFVTRRNSFPFPCEKTTPQNPRMGEVTEEADLEVKKPDCASESLPEPLLIILSPPPPFLPAPGEPAIFWNKWLKAFEHYLEALGENELVDSSKCALLQNCLGQEGQRVFTSLSQREASYASAVAALTVYFGSDAAARPHLVRFYQRAQMPGESVEQFASALEVLLKPCRLGGSQEKLVLRQLREKTRCPPLRERLLAEKEALTLDVALAIGREVESAECNPEPLGVHEVSVDIGDDSELPVRRKRGRPRRGEGRPKPKPESPKTKWRSSRYRDEFYYNNDKLYHSDGDECRLKTADEADLTRHKSSRHDDDDNGCSSSRVKEEDALDKASDDDDDGDDEDFIVGRAKGKGPSCPFCPSRRFRDSNKLSRHMRTHTKEKPFNCPLCTLTFSQSYHMTRHMRNQHGAGRHICPTCGKSLENAADLQAHRRTHSSQEPSRPERQDRFPDDDDTLASHVATHPSRQPTRTAGDDAREKEPSLLRKDDREVSSSGADEDSDGGGEESGSDVDVKAEGKDSERGGKRRNGVTKVKAKGHFCPICVNRCFRGANKLARHMRMHTKEKPFSCPVCSLTFSQSYHMTRHLRKQHGMGHYICTKCGTSLGSWVELKEHKKTHAAEGLSCSACQKQFKEKPALVNHLKSHKKDKSTPRCLSCSDCGKEFCRMYHLKRHILAHRKATNGECYDCPECQKSYAFPEDLKKHRRIHAKENNGTCPKCNRTFGSPEELETHMAVHKKSFACDTCGKKFKVEYALKKHEQGHQVEQYYCSLCRKRFIKLSHYKRHVLVHGRRESRCPHCDGVFLKLTALKYHLRTHTEERPFQCSCCIESFEEKRDLEQHCLKHRKFKRERPYSCTRCDYAFPSLMELTEHMSLHVGEQPLSCPVCGKTFLNKNKLEKHLSIHTGERPHLCSLCGNGFPSAASLKLHSHIHTGEKPFKCSVCGKSFSSSSGLRLHGRQHMEVRPSYECPECGRTYGRMTELKMHQRYHTGDKPYACTCCSKRFISKDKLNVHMRIHTGERPYSCPHCGQTFTQTGDRNRHINKYHS